MSARSDVVEYMTLEEYHLSHSSNPQKRPRDEQDEGETQEQRFKRRKTEKQVRYEYNASKFTVSISFQHTPYCRRSFRWPGDCVNVRHSHLILGLYGSCVSHPRT